MGNPLILLEDVRLTLTSAAGPVNVLRGISATIDSGTTIGLVGPSGSGKSTLMMVLGGLERISSGRVEIAGAKLGALDEDALARFRRDHIGIVFQSFHLIPTMTALENVAVPLELAGRKDAFAVAAAGLTAVGLRTGCCITRRSYRAASSSVSRSRALLPRARRCCSPTSRPEISTAIPGAW